MSAPRVLGVITARGGSKGVPRKNIRPLCGKPLIGWTIEAAVAVRHLFHRLIVSTDDPEIAKVARQFGAEAPFLRRPELSGDRVPMLPVLQDAVAFAEADSGVPYDWVLLLQPTTPLRRASDIAEALELAFKGGCDSVISVVQVFAVHPILMKKIEDDRLVPFCVEEREGTRRQDYDPPAYMRNGAIYLSRRDVIMAGSIWGRSIRPFVMPEERSANIDSEMDFRLCEALISRLENVEAG